MKRYIRSGTTLHYNKSAFSGFVGDQFTTDLDSFISRFETVEGDPSSRYVLFLKRSNIAHSYYEKVIYFNDLDECKRVAKDLIYNNAPNPEKWYEDHYYVNIVDQDTGEEIFYADAWQEGKKGWYDTIESAVEVPEYRPGDVVYRGNAIGYQSTSEIQGDINKFPDSLADYVCNIYYVGDNTYKVEWLTDEDHLFEENYQRFFKKVYQVLKNCGFQIEGQEDTITSSYEPMDFDNKMDVMKWLDDAEKVIRKLCKEISNDKYFFEIDDVRWGTDCFEIPIFKGYWNDDPLSGPGRYEQYDLFRFCYDRDDTFERSAEEQLKDELDEFLSTYDKERKFAAKMRNGRYEV